MPRNKPFEQFGPYILFKKLEADALGDLWRAARIENGQLGPTVALRRLTGGNRQAMTANAQAVAQILPRINGTSFVREQHAGVVDGVPYLSWEYAGGRSLRYIVDRSRGSKDVQPNPLPLDQAISIAEKVALSLATMADLRDTNGAKLAHGALLPQFIWITDDGEIRVGGQQLGTAMMASMQEPKLAAESGRYFSPEHRASGQVNKNGDVYSMGAVLFLLITGHEPPDAMSASAFVAAVRAGKTTTGEPIPDDLRIVLDKSFNLDPSMRYASMGDMKQALSSLANSGRYSATTFNLAFYLSSLLKKELEVESADREKESHVDVAPYLEAPQPVAATPAAVAPVPIAPAAPVLSTPQSAQKSRAPLFAAAAVVTIAALGAGGYMMLGKTSSQPASKQIAAAQTLPGIAPPAHRVISEPIAVSATPATGTAALPATVTTGSADSEAQKKAFEDAVRQKMQAEMMKLQNDFLTDLKQKQPKNAPAVAAPVTAIAAPPVQTASVAPEERSGISAAQLDQQRREARADQSTDTAPRTLPMAPQTQTSAPAPQVSLAAPAPAPKPSLREGDVVDVASLDSVPRPTRAVRPQYPALAARQKIAATIFLTVFVSETGEVLDVRVLRGDNRFGLNEAAIRALRSAHFTSPMKDGKRVRTWFPQTIEFKP